MAMVKLLPIRTRVILEAINQVGGKQSAEHHDFSQQKDPHSKRGGVLLLLHAVKLMGQRRMMLGSGCLASGQR
jgi:hypothetical protein